LKSNPYGMVCPLTHACAVLEPRWTIPILAELWNGSTRFNDIRRGVGSISPALLSKRLKELEEKGLVKRQVDQRTKQVEYHRTPMAIALEPAFTELSNWAQRNIEARTALADADMSTQMWAMRRLIYVDELPKRKQIVIRFHFSDEDLEYDTYWALIRQGFDIEICSTIPDFDVDLYIETDKTTLNAILLSRTTIHREIERGSLVLIGDSQIARSMDRWLYHWKTLDRKEIRQLT